MNVREMVLPLPEAMSVETIEMLEQASATMFRALRRSAQPSLPDAAGATEYDSWTAGALEYESWSRRS